MNNKETFILYKLHYEPIKHLSTEQMGLLFRAIFEYQTIGKEIKLDAETNIAFRFFKNQFIIDDEKYQIVKEKRSIAGKKGREVNVTNENQNKISENQNKYLLASDSKKQQNKQTTTNETKNNKINICQLNDNDNGNDNDYDNHNNYGNNNDLKGKNTKEENDEIIIQFENEVWTKYPFVSNKKQSLQKWKNKTEIERLKFLEIYNDFLDYCKLATWYSKDLQFLLNGNNWDVDWKTKTEQEKAKYNARGQPTVSNPHERYNQNFSKNLKQKEELDIDGITKQFD